MELQARPIAEGCRAVPHSGACQSNAISWYMQCATASPSPLLWCANCFISILRLRNNISLATWPLQDVWLPIYLSSVEGKDCKVWMNYTIKERVGPSKLAIRADFLWKEWLYMSRLVRAYTMAVLSSPIQKGRGEICPACRDCGKSVKAVRQGRDTM